MILLEKPGLDPWFNLAAEEFAVRQLTEEVLMLWENDWCVVTGKHQLAYAEIHPAEVFGREVPVIRRISGGGTVVHGPGNLNFTLITDNSSKTNKIDFAAATRPIINFLAGLGLKVELSMISNLSVNNLKISGNAAHVFKNRSMHHGTLLFNADLDAIRRLIRRPDHPYQSKAIASNPVEVANISSLSNTSVSFGNFNILLQEYLIKHLTISEIRGFSQDEISAIQKLVLEKYATDQWNFGYSPDYTFEKQVALGTVNFRISLEVKRGIITDVLVDGSREFSQLPGLMRGKAHTPACLRDIILSSGISELISEPKINHFLWQLF